MSLLTSSVARVCSALTVRTSSVHQLAGCALAALALLAPGTAHAQLYISGLNRDLGINRSFGMYDVTSKTYTYIGQTPFRFFDIAFDNQGTLFGIRAIGDTYLIDPTTAQSTLLATVDPALNAMAFRPTDNALFVVGTVLGGNTTGVYNQLYNLNPYTGATTLLGQTGGYESAGDLAFDIDNNMYLSTTSGDLIRLDQTNGTPTLIGNTGFSNINGIAYDRLNRVMYGVTDAPAGRNVFTIDLTTGQGTLVGKYDDTMDAAGSAFRGEASQPIPEPSALALLLPVVGAAGAIVRRRTVRAK